MTASRKLDLKFPFDLLKDTPEQVVQEMQEAHFELSPRSMEAVRL